MVHTRIGRIFSNNADELTGRGFETRISKLFIPPTFCPYNGFIQIFNPFVFLFLGTKIIKIKSVNIQKSKGKFVYFPYTCASSWHHFNPKPIYYSDYVRYKLLKETIQEADFLKIYLHSHSGVQSQFPEPFQHFVPFSIFQCFNPPQNPDSWKNLLSKNKYISYFAATRMHLFPP